MTSTPETEYHEHAGLAGQKRAAREENHRASRGETNREALEETRRATAKTEIRATTELRPFSPYTVKNLDAAIAHLEIAMNADKTMAIFGESYWHGRVLELRSTPGIMHAQERRLLGLMDLFAATADKMASCNGLPGDSA
jgi:hypothetical protein